MALDGSDVPGTPAWWVKVLTTELLNRRHGRTGSKLWNRGASKPQRIRPGIDLLHDHLMGDPPLRGVADGWQEHFREASRLGRLNAAALVVDAKADRMAIRGFRTAAASDELGDSVARDIMKANHLKVRAREVHDYQLSMGDGYTMVTPPPDGEKWPVITAEDPRETITAEDPATGRTYAALKAYRDEWDAVDVIHLYVRPDKVAGVNMGEEGLNRDQALHYVAQRKGVRSAFTGTSFRLGSTWEWEGGRDVLDRMPIHRFRNRRGIGEFEWHIDTLDRINDQILNKLVIAKVQAFRQMAVKNLPETTETVDPETGSIVETEVDYTDVFVAAPGSFWQLPEGVDIWESTPTDFGPVRLAIKDDLEHLAAVTSTALHILTPDAAGGSAEGAGLMREQSSYAVENCRDHAELGWVETMATAFAFMKDDEGRADPTKIEVLWGPLERYGLSEKADAASKLGLVLPREAIQRDIMQYDPYDVTQLRQLDGRDILFQAPTPTSPGQATGDASTPPPVVPPTPTPEPPGGNG